MISQDTTLEKIKNYFEDNEFIYIIYSEYGCKIGISNNPQRRLDQIKQGLPSQNALLIGLYNGKDCAKFEKLLHKEYKKRKIAGEWFILNQENLDEIDNYLLANDFIRFLKQRFYGRIIYFLQFF